MIGQLQRGKREYGQYKNWMLTVKLNLVVSLSTIFPSGTWWSRINKEVSE